MPLKPSELLQALSQTQSVFKDFSTSAADIFESYRQALAKVSSQSHTEIAELLSDHEHPGARPLEPSERTNNWILNSKLNWNNREQSLQWVRTILDGVTTFAVDGSQIFPSKDVSPPIALVQVGWFANPHSQAGDYQKDNRLALMTPAELDLEDTSKLNRQVSMKRFQMEVERIIEFMETHPSCQDCLVFFDGSLVATFAEASDFDCKLFYAKQMVQLLRASEHYRVPLVGFIDTSQACDLCQMLRTLEVLPETTLVNDAQLLDTGMSWGDRTPVFSCDRTGDARSQGILSLYVEQSDQIAFSYLKTNANAPVRLEFPRWLYDDGQFERILNYVRAEVVIGGGYPYAIETADQVAVLQSGDRRLFYQLVQDWSEKASVNISFSRKMVSKQLRR